MYDAEYQRNYFKRRKSIIPKSGYRFSEKDHAPRIRWNEMTIRRKVISLHAQDAEFRSCRGWFQTRPYVSRDRCLQAGRKSRLKTRHGINVAQYDGQLAAQHGACACCHAKLGGAVRIDHPVTDTIPMLCVGCFRRVESLRHVREHAGAFEAFMKQRGMTLELSRFYEIMRRCGWTPAQNETEARPS